MAAPRFAPIEFGDGTRIDLDTGAIDWGGAALDIPASTGGGEDAPTARRGKRRGWLSVRLATEGDPVQCAEALPAAWKRIHALYSAPGPAKRHEAYQHGDSVQVRLDIDGAQGRIALFAQSAHGFVFRPESDAAPHGWGLPRTPSNSPLGTPGGGNPYCKLTPYYSKTGDFVRNRLKRGVPISDLNGDNRRYGNIDWEWTNAKGTLGYLSWHGPAGRSVPFFDTLQFGPDPFSLNTTLLSIATSSPNVDTPHGSPQRYLDAKLYLNGKLLLNFGSNIKVHGAAIRKIGNNNYIIAIVGVNDIATSTTTLQAAKVSLKDALKNTATPSIAFDILGYDGLFDRQHSPIKWEDVCFFFNRSGNQAVGVIPVKRILTQPGGEVWFYKTAKILVRFDSSGFVSSVESEVSPDYVETKTRTGSNGGDGFHEPETSSTHEAVSGSLVNAVVACDYIGDVLQTAYATIIHTSSSDSASSYFVAGAESGSSSGTDTLDITLSTATASYHYVCSQSGSGSSSGDVSLPPPGGWGVPDDTAFGQWSSSSNSTDNSNFPFILYIDLRYGIFVFLEINMNDSSSNSASGCYDHSSIDLEQRILSQSVTPTVNHTATIKTSFGDAISFPYPNDPPLNPYRFTLYNDEYYLDTYGPGSYRYYACLDFFAISNPEIIRDETVTPNPQYYQLAVQPSVASLDKDNIFISLSLPPMAVDWAAWLAGTASPQHFHKIYHKDGVIDAAVAVTITGANQKYASLGVV